MQYYSFDHLCLPRFTVCQICSIEIVLLTHHSFTQYEDFLPVFSRENAVVENVQFDYRELKATITATMVLLWLPLF
jgi:hypothetical protein